MRVRWIKALPLRAPEGLFGNFVSVRESFLVLVLKRLVKVAQELSRAEAVEKEIKNKKTRIIIKYTPKIC